MLPPSDMDDDVWSYNTSEDGKIVFTAAYLLQRGYCCGNGCRNCPYDYKNVPEPKRSRLLKEREDKKHEP